MTLKIDPDGAGLDQRRLQRITEHFTRRYIEPGKLAGCQVLVARHGAVGYFKSFGLMDLERARPVREDSIWRIYSMTKPITSVALMALYEEGHFQLSDPVHRFIPEWRDMKVRGRTADGAKATVEPERPMTVRDLLMHMSGLSYGNALGEAETSEDDAAVPSRDDDITLEEFVARLAGVTLRFQPGARWLYSYATDVCGRLVEIISGQRFDAFLRARLFQPLGMVDTGFVLPDSDLERFAANYGRRRDKTLTLVDDPETSVYRAPRAFLSGGGGLLSTSADYLRFCQMLASGGELDGVRVLGRKTIELMRSNHLPGGGDLREFAVGQFGETAFDGVGFGLGFAVTQGPVQTQTIGSPGEYFWGGAASTIFWNDPVEDLTVIFMTQLMPSATFNFRGQLRTLVYPAIVD